MDLCTKKLKKLIDNLYKNQIESTNVLKEIIKIVDSNNKNVISNKLSRYRKWDQTKCFLITYPNSIIKNGESPLKTLSQFLVDHLELIDCVHILPFMPSSSDAGFSVIDYYKIDNDYGDWNDLKLISNNKNIMIDLVLNHASSKSQWFYNFLSGKGEGSDYFKVVKNWSGEAQIERPRTTNIFKDFSTKKGVKTLWCTFSHDQIDLDFGNPKVLIEFLKIIKFYVEKNIKIFRLDAVAFLWKEKNTNCINRPETHTIIKIIRLFADLIDKDIIVLTETNLPNKENLSYFGKSDESDWIYNFTLSPLILYTLISGNCDKLRKWSMSMPPADDGHAYINFLSTHDGIGVRPIEDRMSDDELNRFIKHMEDIGSKISYKTTKWGEKVPYEINTTYLDGLKTTFCGDDNLQIKRFQCAYVIMMAMEGIPAIYIHNIIGTRNNYDLIKLGKEKRTINRSIWDANELYEKLDDKKSTNYKILKSFKKILKIRQKQPAFHPNATQFTLNLGNSIFGIWRQDRNRKQSIFSISNITHKHISFPLEDINLIENEFWYDLLSNESINYHAASITMKPYQSLWITNYLSKPKI